ncbi:hypothetical protein [Acinetobacter sp. ANC 3813]|uniref:hypothetical protein n=1 Tax=Acinetobacter sp. ANC 3813 TaxID=1977873 RepID=UPI000A3320C1|nr:hypothetical protein [Acinetobacter sp. ANC 3813]OTG91653.1 hypothetical protein B9T34_03865 [Acinetobacter sp. ANC 3813]
MLLRHLGFGFILLCTAIQVQATEFDQYLQSKNIIDERYKIQQAETLNEILSVLSAEDSRTLPLEIDHNTIIEQLNLYADHTDLKGIITTPDFAQFEQDLGHKQVEKLIKKNLVQNCNIFFEHEYQRSNPYSIKLQLSSESKNYVIELKQKNCKVK